MGCNNTKPLEQAAQNPRNSSNGNNLGMKPNPLTEQELQMRIDCPKQSQSLELGGVTFRYAWVSQRGYYPESPDKDNQDTYLISPSFGATSEQQAFFAIFDGHGKDGHHCARFARDHLGKNILEKFSRIPAGNITPKAVRQALSIAHYSTNEAMHSEKRFDDSLSGTTAISILFRGKVMYVSNVGDSRAIVVSKTEEGKLVAKPLSSDQTPYRKDERERVKKYGARILSMDQIEGLEPVHENWGDLNLGEDIDEGGDPPRIWSPNGDYPGTAFTRSLGDMLAEECGVIPEPEILEREIQPNDRFVVIASDGVFEFLTNQMVADMLARFTDPLDACKAVVTASYNMWLQYEVRTDDISIIALYVDNISKVVGFGQTSSFFENKAGHSAQIEQMEARPVRRVISREKRKHMIALKDDDEGDTEPLSEADTKDLLLAKSEAEEQIILSAMRTNFLFQHLNTTQRTAVVSVMKPVDVSQGDWIIKQGDAGDKFYIVDHGRYEVRVKPPTSTSPPSVDGSDNGNGAYQNRFLLTDEELERLAGNVVHVYESGVDQHPGFGELSLMYGKPRAASVIALTDGKLWALDRKIFRKVVLRPKDFRREIIRTLKKVELLKCLTITQLQRLTDLLNERTFAADEMIIRQGEQGDTFYLIEKGHCECSINSPDGAPPKVVMQLRDNNYFGERALLESKPRAANVRAVVETKVLYIDKTAFEEVLGPLAQIIDEDRARREAAAAAELSAPKAFTDVALKSVVSVDGLGPILLGSFKSDVGRLNTTVRSFVLTDVMKGSMTDSVARYIETSRLLQHSITSVQERSVLLPTCLSIFKQSNALHMIYDSVIVADLSTFIRNHSSDFISNENYLTYCFGCIVSALEKLHEHHIIYRAIQPESISIDAKGHVVLMDYRFCKLGIYGSNKTFTICGASDYLAPEQISQTGHSYPVDLWGMGVLLYELAVGSHPFSSNTEVATYSKITSFGTKSFPALKFPDNFNNDVKSLINQLLVPTPEARIGAGLSGFHSLKKHAFFKSFNQWESIHFDGADVSNSNSAASPTTTTGSGRVVSQSIGSPIAVLAQQEYEELAADPLDPTILQQFDVTPNPAEFNLDWLKHIDV